MRYSLGRLYIQFIMGWRNPDGEVVLATQGRVPIEFALTPVWAGVNAIVRCLRCRRHLGGFSADAAAVSYAVEIAVCTLDQ